MNPTLISEPVSVSLAASTFLALIVALALHKSQWNCAKVFYNGSVLGDNGEPELLGT